MDVKKKFSLDVTVIVKPTTRLRCQKGRLPLSKNKESIGADMNQAVSAAVAIVTS